MPPCHTQLIGENLFLIIPSVSKDTGKYRHLYAAGVYVNWQYHFREKFDNFRQNWKLYRDFPGGSVVKNVPAMQEMQLQSLGQEDPWRRKWEPTPVFLLGNTTEKPAGLQSLESQRVGHNLVTQQWQWK